MRKVVFINAHWNHLLMNSMQYYLFNIKAPAKYSSLFKELVNCEKLEIINYVSNYGNMIPRSFWGLHFSFFSKMESRYVLKKNGYDKRVKTITKISQLQPDDIIIAFVHSKGGADDIYRFKSKILVHLNQFHFHRIEVLNRILPYADAFILETNVFQEGNYIHQCKLPEKVTFYELPYIVGDRFVCAKPFGERINKAVATGTIGICQNEDYEKKYGTKLCHKMRKVIYDNKQELAPYLESYISPYIESSKMKQINGEMFVLKKYFNIIYNNYIGKVGKQTKYFSFDIVEKYNEYQMAVVPEEIVGIPAIGAFEAMACGCAFIGIRHKMYDDLGLTPGRHYIPYDGSCEDLKRVISYYQVHFSELQKIAEQGCNFVNGQFRSKQILNRFISIVSELTANNN